MQKQRRLGSVCAGPALPDCLLLLHCLLCLCVGGCAPQCSAFLEWLKTADEDSSAEESDD